jgi:hypothetical protein
MLDLWHTLSTSPILTHFRWSSLVLDAVKKNAQSIHPMLAQDPLPDSPIPGLMVVHVRRGDYEQHIKFLAKHSADYMGWCKTDGVSDTFNPPGDAGVETEEKIALYEDHGYPSQERISKRIREIRDARSDPNTPLRSLHIMSNGDDEYLSELKKRIQDESGENAWDTITTCKDLSLDNEQRYVSIPISQVIAERAEVFVGNGVSAHNLFRVSHSD